MNKRVCPVYKAPAKHVPAEWPDKLPCRIAFVGEAPSDDELLHGRPLVGPSGRVFNQLLAAADLKRSEYLITNVFDFQLPDNDVKNICANTGEMRSWESYDLPPVSPGAYLRPEYLPQLARLDAEIQRASPVVLVPLGATALWAFTGATSIASSRGSIMQATRLARGVKMVPTLHPAHVIHEWKMFGPVVGDLMKAERESAFPEIRRPHRELWLEPTLDDLCRFKAEHLDGAELVTCDIETGWGQITCIGFAPSDTHAICVPFWDLRRPSKNYWPTVDDELAALNWCADILGSDTPKLFQNGPYDIMWLWDRYGIPVRNYRHDTRLIHHALYPELPKSLEFMGATYGSQGAWKMMAPHRQQEKRDA